MDRLIKAEFYKLRKSIYYKVLLIVSVIYAVTDVCFSCVGVRGYDSSSGLEAFIYSYTMWGVCLLISGICAGVFIAGDFNNRILHAEIAIGNSRKNIFLSKTIVYWTAGFEDYVVR